MALPALLARAALAYTQAQRYTPATQRLAATVGYSVGYGIDALKGAANSVATRELGYQAERLATNHIPEVSQIMAAYWGGKLSNGDISLWLSYHGVPFRDWGAQGNANTDMWRRILDHSRPHFDVSAIVDHYKAGRLTREQSIDRLKRTGFSRPDDVNLILRNRGWFGLGEATDLWQQGFLDDAAYRAAILRAGIGEEQAIGWMFTQTTPLPLPLAAQRFYREQDTDLQYLRWARRAGYREDVALMLRDHEEPLSAADALLLTRDQQLLADRELSYSLHDAGIHTDARRALWRDAQRPRPSLPEAIQLGMGLAYRQDVAARYMLDADVPPTLARQAQVWGYDWVTSEYDAAGDVVAGIPAWRPFWRAAHTLLAPQQAFEAARRFDEAGAAELGGERRGMPAFTREDVDLHTRAAGLGPVHARWLEALSRPQIGPGQWQQLYAFGLATSEELRDGLTRLGYSPADQVRLRSLARVRGERAKRQWAIQQLAKARTLAYGTAQQGYADGVYDADATLQLLVDLGLDRDAAELTLKSWTAANNLSYLKEMEGRIRKGYLSGEFSVNEVTRGLQALALDPDAIRVRLQRWALARTWTRRAASTGQILTWVAKGMLTPDVARARLVNLGWTNPDTALMLAQAEGALKSTQARAKAAEDKAKLKHAAELEKINKAHAAELKANVAQLRRMTPLGTLKKLLIDGIASEDWVRDRLTAMEYESLEIDALIADWKRAPKTDPGPQILPPLAPPPPPPPPPLPPPPTTVAGVPLASPGAPPGTIP